MSTVSKAISLLEILGRSVPEMALADLAKSSGFDKATTRRLLVSLIAHGLVEQEQTTRLYRLGPGLTRLALMRETQFPLLRIAVPEVQTLAVRTEETVHLSEYSKQGLVTVHVAESPKANRVSVKLGEALPLHATASGIVFLAFAQKHILEEALAGPLPAFTPYTISDARTLADHVATASARGYSTASQGYEDGVLSVAAPILGADGFAIGTIAVAAPSVRVRKGEIGRLGASTAAAARVIGDRLLGQQSPHGQKRA